MAENMSNSTGGSRFSLHDSRFSESNTSLQISSININNNNNNNCDNAKTSKRLVLGPLSHVSRDNCRSDEDGMSMSMSMAGPASSSMLEDSSKYISGDGIQKILPKTILTDIYTPPEINHFDERDSLYSPDTPITPSTPLIHPRTIKGDYDGESVDRVLGIDDIIPPQKSYPLVDEELEKFVLNTDVFELTLDAKIGKGSNAYVYSCELSTKGLTTANVDNSFNVAVKIPSARNKVKYILQEAKFALKLRKYQSEWFAKKDRVYPFIDCYGLYYLGKQDFPLFKSSQELLPCLVMKKMTMSLPAYINMKVQKKKDACARTNSIYNSSEFRLPIRHWWKLCQTLMDALAVLKHLECVHCDIKTDNIMVICYGYSHSGDTIPLVDDLDNVDFKVIDFSSAGDVKSMTKCPDMTLQYTAPELLQFGKPRIPTYSSDAYSAGLVLYEAATGSPPYASAGYDHFLLVGVIKEGRVFEWASPEDLDILATQPAAVQVIRQLVEERCSVEDVSLPPV